ncbi:hypothetical protein BC830DRAFT_189808 [Chytriomyces sp. MP71]|nr:hypothetical protein BC830DRAFT_189808 [Chytriomyces sp. MP71]
MFSFGGRSKSRGATTTITTSSKRGSSAAERPLPAPPLPSREGESKDCLFCAAHSMDTQPSVRLWPDVSSPSNASAFYVVLKAIAVFLDRLDQYPTSCPNCHGKETLFLVGRSGVGKSVALNLIANKVPRFVKGSLVGLSIEFDDPASKVYHSNESGTLFPFVHVTKDRVVVDFPGFYENRSAGLEFLQRCVMKKMLDAREGKVILCKSVLAERDTSFAAILRSEIMVPGSSMIVYTKASVETAKTWEAGVDAKERADIAVKFKASPAGLPCVLLKKPEAYFMKEPRSMADSFLKELNGVLAKLEPIRAGIMSKESDALGMLVTNSTIVLQGMIRDELSKRLRKAFDSLQFQPYHVPVIKSILTLKEQFPSVIIGHFKQLGLVEVSSVNSSDSLMQAASYWDIFKQSGLHPKGISCIDIVNESELAKLQSVMDFPETNMRLNPDLSLPEMLLQWVTLRERFWLEYVAYKGQAMHLLVRALEDDSYGTRVAECKVMVDYRLGRCRGMEEAWCVVAGKLKEEMMEYHRVVQESAMAAKSGNPSTAISGASVPPMSPRTTRKTLAGILTKKKKDSDAESKEGAGVALVEAEAAYKFLELVLKPDLLEKCLEVGFKVFREDALTAKNMIVGGLATAASAISGAFTSSTEAAAGGAAGGAAGEIAAGTVLSSGAVVGIAVVATVGVGLLAYGGMQLYRSYEEQRQLNEGGLLGLDFSQFAVEMGTWTEVQREISSIGKSGVQISTVLTRVRAHFKKFEEDFSFSVKASQLNLTIRLDQMRQLESAHDQFIDQWINIVAKNQHLASTIIGQLIGRARSTVGCSYQEHSLISPPGLMRMPSCCSNFLTWSTMKQCIHCLKNFHDPDSDGGMESSCVVNARAILCVDLMNNPEALAASASIGVEVFFTFERSYQANVKLSHAMRQTAAKYSSAVYTFADSMVDKVNSNYNGNASAFKAYTIKQRNILFCVFVSNNVAYVVFRGTEPMSVANWGTNLTIAPERFDECNFHSGYLAICQEVMNLVRTDLANHATIVFAGHSLGGALAHTLHALYLLMHSDAQYKSTHSIGFGSPPSFGSDTAQFLTKHALEERFVTIVNKGDPVPMSFQAIQYAAEEAKKTESVSQYAGLSTLITLGQIGDQIAGASALYQYCGTYVLFETANGFEVERKVLVGHDRVSRSRWMSAKELARCRVEDHRMQVYEQFVKQWMELDAETEE